MSSRKLRNPRNVHYIMDGRGGGPVMAKFRNIKPVRSIQRYQQLEEDALRIQQLEERLARMEMMSNMRPTQEIRLMFAVLSF